MVRKKFDEKISPRLVFSSVQSVDSISTLPLTIFAHLPIEFSHVLKFLDWSSMRFFMLPDDVGGSGVHSANSASHDFCVLSEELLSVPSEDFMVFESREVLKASSESTEVVRLLTSAPIRVNISQGSLRCRAVFHDSYHAHTVLLFVV